MAEHLIDIATWYRADQFRLFRPFERPHYAITVRQDVTHLMEVVKPRGVSVYRACLYGIGCGLDAVPALKQSFRGDGVVQFDSVTLSMTVPRDHGTFGLGYIPFDRDFARFDAAARTEIARVQASGSFEPSVPVDGAVAYVSCVPWMDFTALDNAMPNTDDCIPRIAWGKIVPEAGGWRVAMSIQVHHALVDGAHLGQFFEAAQDALNGL